jgi:Fur family peroxide stress response transcriptional regulator
MDQKTQHSYLDNFIKQCREETLNITTQRLAIYKALIEYDSHPSPEIIFKKIHQEYPTISLATVYKTLETFEKHGIISMVTTLHDTLRYDPITKRHHHIVCVRCKKVMDLLDPKLDSIRIPEKIRRNNQLIDFSVHFQVICNECKAKR